MTLAISAQWENSSQLEASLPTLKIQLETTMTKKIQKPGVNMLSAKFLIVLFLTRKAIEKA
ncbi:MAG: hypothetical protein ACI4AB_11010 [Acetatifactor sp.]